MALPNDELATALLTAAPSGTNVYRSLTNEVVAPAVVIRPDSTWMAPSRFCAEQQQWAAVAVAAAASPQGAQDILYALVRSVIHHLPPGFAFVNTGGVVLDESTGTAFLAVAIHLTYDNGEGI